MYSKKQRSAYEKPPGKGKEANNMTQKTGIATTQNAFSELANFNLSDAMSQELEGLSLSLNGSRFRQQAAPSSSSPARRMVSRKP